MTDIRQNEEIIELGIEIMGLSVLSVQPTKDTAHALEAETREKILKTADDAIYVRRNASIEQERGVKENEYNTEIAVENKRRQVRETQLATEQAEMQKKHELEVEQLDFQIAQEEKRKTLVAIEAENTRAQADAKAYELKAMVDVLKGLDTDTDIEELNSPLLHELFEKIVVYEGKGGRGTKRKQRFELYYRFVELIPDNF